MIVLENEFLKVQVNPAGAELWSLFGKRHGLEYLWQGDPRHWPGRSPILFPVIGKLKDGRYSLDGREYSLSPHGFARDREFEVVETDALRAVLRLESDASTLAVYPFPFRLQAAYELQQDSLVMTLTVENPGGAPLLFSLGWHPGFRLGLNGEPTMDGYRLEFPLPENAGRYEVESGFLTGETSPLLDDQYTLVLDRSLFARAAVVLKDLRSGSVELRSERGDRGLRVEFPGYPVLAIWSKPEEAPFVCIEPWHGLPDSVDSPGMLERKEGMRRLDPGASFACSLVVTPF